MDTYAIPSDGASQERITAQRYDRVIEEIRLCGELMQRPAEFACPFAEDFFRDGVRGKKGAAA